MAEPSEGVPSAPVRAPARASTRLPAILAAVGFLSSLALEFVHFQTYVMPSTSSVCTVSAAFDCTSVAASTYSVFLGLPWALWGAFGFLGLLVAALRGSSLLVPLSSIAAVVSLALFAISLGKIGSLCLFCEVTHVAAIALAIATWKQRRSLAPVDADALLFGLALPAGLAAIAWFALPSYWSAHSYRGAPNLPTGVTAEGDPWIGAKEPSLVVHEYADYTCPHCKVATVHSLRLLGKHSKVRLVRHQHPRMRCKSSAPSSCESTRAALCAMDQGRFWQADRWLFTFPEVGHPIDREKLASDVKLDLQKLRACMDLPATYDRANETYKQTVKRKIVDAPGYTVEGRPGRISQAKLSAIMAEAD